MPFSYPLPAELVDALDRVRKVEAAADTLDRQRRAVAATGALLLAASNQGWSITAMAVELGTKPGTATARVLAARARLRVDTEVVVVDPSPKRLRADPARTRLDTPVEQREWLTSAEAVEVAGVSVSTIQNWLRAGLLPNTQRGPRRHLYLRADLLRVGRVPRHNEHGASYAALREQIAWSAV